MRTLGIIFLSFTPFLFGLDYSKTLKKRKAFLVTFKEFILFIRDQIRFSGRERDEIMALALNDPRFNHPLFSNLELALKKGENITKRINIINYIRLKPKEIYEIDSFVSGLGKNDTEGQLNHCDYYISVFESVTKNLDEEILVKSRLSVGLSLSLSAVMFIIMI